MNNIKMVVMDLDGTLLKSDKTISGYTISILEKCKKKGIKIAFATARSDISAKRIIDLINPNIMILNDGALIKYEGGKIIYKKLISKETSDEIISQCINNINIGNIAVEAEYGYYVTYKDSYHPDFDYGQHYDFNKQLSQKTYKICVEIFMENVALDIKNKFNECNMIYTFGENWYRFYHNEVSKMAGLKIISKDQNISLSEIIAFGDDYNDIEMIKGCGMGIAMENGIEEIKKISKYICGNNDHDGVGKWIEENIL